MILLLIFAFLSIILIEIPHLIRDRMWKELGAFSLFLAIGIALAVPQTLGMTVPNPLKIVEVIFKPAADWLK